MKKKIIIQIRKVSLSLFILIGIIGLVQFLNQNLHSSNNFYSNIIPENAETLDDETNTTTRTVTWYSQGLMQNPDEHRKNESPSSGNC